MIYLTGDTHGGCDTKKLVSRKVAETIHAGDVLIICGDFGFVYDYKKESGKEKTWLDWFKDRPWTTVFVDGNHECFPRLYAYPEKEWCGGKVHEIRPNLFHLIRGEMYTIEGHTFFAMGGARSHDRGPAKGDTKAVIGKHWWPEEVASLEEQEKGLETLKAHENQVDYIITHCLPTRLQDRQTEGKFPPDEMSNYLEKIKDVATFEHWYCGHYHVDRDLTEDISILFNKIIPLGEKVQGSDPIVGSPIYQKRQSVQFKDAGGVEMLGIIKNVYPWGMMKDHTQPLYDIIVSDGTGREIKFVGERSIISVIR